MVIELVTQFKTRLGDTGCPTNIFKLGDKMSNKLCKTCGVTFIPSVGSKGTYCSKQCHHKDQGNISKAIAAQKQEAAKKDYESNPRRCAQCSQVLLFIQRQNKFCSRSCSAINTNTARERHITPEFVAQQRARALANPQGWAKTRLGGKPNRAPRETRICLTCKKPFEILKSNPRVSCSQSCVQVGGLREGSGRSKTGWYQGIYCGSTYELAFLIWHLDHKIPIARCTDKFTYTYQDKTHTYHPDFVVGDTIYEIKGRLQPVDYVKITSANAVLVDKTQIKKYIDYVATTYHVAKDKLYKLYN